MSAFKRGVNRRKPKWDDDWCEKCQSHGNVHDPEKHGIRMSKKEGNACETNLRIKALHRKEESDARDSEARGIVIDALRMAHKSGNRG